MVRPMVRHTMKHKKIDNGKYPTYTFRLDPETVRELEKVKGEESWNQLFKNIFKLKYI